MTPPKASDAAIAREVEYRLAHRGGNWSATDYGLYPEFTTRCDERQALSDALLAHFGADVPASLAGFVLPVVVDPIVQMVREAFANACRSRTARDEYLAGHYDDHYEVRAALSVARAIAAQGGGK